MRAPVKITEQQLLYSRSQTARLLGCSISLITRRRKRHSADHVVLIDAR
jgi:hypothetical protein